MSGMGVTRIREGLWRWTVRHPEWNGATDWDEVVGSVYCETPQAVVVIDPLVPEDRDDAARFWDAFDRDVERLGMPVVVLLTCRWHVRHAQAFRDRYGARVYAPTDTGHAVEDVVTDRVGDEAVVVPGVLALLTGSPAPNEECVYILTGHHTAIVGDVLSADDAGNLRVADPGWYADSEAECAWYRDGLAASLERILAYDVEHLLLAHGAPIAPDPETALRSVLSRHGETRWT